MEFKLKLNSQNCYNIKSLLVVEVRVLFFKQVSLVMSLFDFPDQFSNHARNSKKHQKWRQKEEGLAKVKRSGGNVGVAKQKYCIPNAKSQQQEIREGVDDIGESSHDQRLADFKYHKSQTNYWEVVDELGKESKLPYLSLLSLQYKSLYKQIGKKDYSSQRGKTAMDIITDFLVAVFIHYKIKRIL